MMMEGVVASRKPAALTIDGGETTDGMIRRLISENPVIIFSRSACCMCHVMKRLLTTIGVHPTVIELDEVEMEKARPALLGGGSAIPVAVAVPGPGPGAGTAADPPVAPAVFIGGAHVGGLESLMALHLSGNLIPKLREVGATWL
ncbi:hypothetical protein H6P81_000138 [Aristolochia fimbriata]|uniref:Glutaredoxin domain-containing protein n=1 Tax=Aristolochia fimbriata TaxID=158543 RepID=A0AAV7F396_ARIFI|nr:hypothetical protein H6P81_000138 [Aristolochia fimbriata]